MHWNKQELRLLPLTPKQTDCMAANKAETCATMTTAAVFRRFNTLFVLLQHSCNQLHQIWLIEPVHAASLLYEQAQNNSN